MSKLMEESGSPEPLVVLDCIPHGFELPIAVPMAWHPMSTPRKWLDSETATEHYLIQNGRARRCMTCCRPILNKYLDGSNNCPDCRAPVSSR